MRDDDETIGRYADNEKAPEGVCNQEETLALLQASQGILKARSFEDAARSIFDTCKNLIGAHSGYVALLTQDGRHNELLFLDPGGLPCEADPSLPMPIRGLREQVYRAGKALFDNDFSGSPWVQYLPKGHVQLENVLFAPLMADGKPVGLLGFANKPEGFSEKDSRMATIFGQLASIALINSRTLDSLKASERRFSSIFHTATDAIVGIDGRGNIILWNMAAEKMFVYSADEVMGKPLTLIIPERLRLAHVRGMERFVSTGETHCVGKTAEVFGLRKDGSEVPLELSVGAYGPRGKAPFIGIIRDIADRKKAEEEARRAHAELERRVVERTEALTLLNESLQKEISERKQAEEEIRRSYDLQEAVDTLLRISLEGAPIKEILDRALDLVLSIPWLSFESRGGIFLVEDEPGVLLMKSQKNLHEPIRKACARVPFGKCLCGRAALNRQIEFADSLDDRHEIEYEGMSQHGHYCVPIMATGELIGVIVIYLQQGHARSQTEEAFLAAMANTLAGILMRRRVEKDLRESRASLANAQRIARLGNWEWDVKTGKLDWSDEIYPIFGFRQREFSPSYEGFLNSVHPEDRESLRKAVDEAIHDKKPYSIDHRVLLPDGSVRIVHEEAEVIWDETGMPMRMAGTAQDITNLKQAEKAMEAMARLKDSLISSTVLISGKLDSEETLSETVSTARRLAGARYAGLAMVKDEEVIRIIHDGLSSEQAGAIDGLPKAKGLKGVLVKERKSVRTADIASDPRAAGFPKGHPVMKCFLGTPIIHGNRLLAILYLADKLGGEEFTAQDQEIIENLAAHVAVAIQNAGLYEELRSLNLELENRIKERTRELEAALQAAKVANQAKSDFLANMSHELRTPLNAIIGFSEVLENQFFGPLNDKQMEYMGDILESGKHLLSLISDILDLSKIEAGRMELHLSPVGIKGLLEGSLVMIKEKALKHGVALHLHVSEDLEGVEAQADERKLKQVLFNLLSNAAKFTPDGGVISLSAKMATMDEPRATSHESLSVVISVEDTGIGIPPGEQEKVFEEFYQVREGTRAKTTGTGLGLPLAKRFVEMHGGRIWVESEGEGKGSRFAFLLPLRRPDPLLQMEDSR